MKNTSSFARFAWFALAYNMVVIIWGVFLRASYSGDGCGQHWLTCGGEVVPSAPELKTVIEFSHRITTAIAGIIVLILAGWAFRRFKKPNWIRITAFFSLVFIVIEGLIGRGLVLTGNTAGNWTPSRPYWTAGHLINTFVLLAFLTLTAWLSNDDRRPRFAGSRKLGLLVLAGAAAILFTGITGSMAALTNMLFPSASVAEGIAKDFAESSHYLLRLRISHPISSVITAVFLLFFAGWLRAAPEFGASIKRWAGTLRLLVLAQVLSGAVTLVMLAPIVMQLIHLFLADAVWISFVVVSANLLTAEQSLPIDPGDRPAANADQEAADPPSSPARQTSP